MEGRVADPEGQFNYIWTSVLLHKKHILTLISFGIYFIHLRNIYGEVPDAGDTAVTTVLAFKSLIPGD